MTTTETPTQYPLDVAEPIHAKDFDTYGTRYPRHPGSLHDPTHWWTEDVMSIVIDAVRGQKLMIEVKGLCWSGVELVGMGSVPGYSSTRTVIVRHFHGHDCTVPRPLPDGRMQSPCPQSCRGYHDTAYPIRDVGMIMPQTSAWLQKGAKWRALDAARTTLGWFDYKTRTHTPPLGAPQVAR